MARTTVTDCDTAGRTRNRLPLRDPPSPKCHDPQSPLWHRRRPTARSVCRCRLCCGIWVWRANGLYVRRGGLVWRFADPGDEVEPHARMRVGQVAVPFGICTEPSNVKAGGQACSLVLGRTHLALSGVTKIKRCVHAGRAIVYASATVRAKASPTSGSRDMSGAVGYLPRGRCCR